MSTQLHPGPHPDPDMLSAFLEGVLTERERAECLAHLAECARCREIAFLAQEPPPVVAAPSPAGWWSRWFAPIPILSGAAVCVLAAGVWLYFHRAPVAQDQYAEARPAPALQAPAPPSPKPGAQLDSRIEVQPKAPRDAQHEAQALARLESPAAKSLPGSDLDSVGGVIASGVAPPPPPVRAPMAAPPSAAMSAPAMAVAAPPPPPPPPPKAEAARNLQLALGAAAGAAAFGGPLKLGIEHNSSAAGDLSEVAGTVTDSSGVVIPNANVAIRQIGGTYSGGAQTDGSGRFKIAALPPGRYDLQIAALGFKTNSAQVELQARDLATVASVLSVGAMTETVEVTASADAFEMSATSQASRTATRLADKKSSSWAATAAIGASGAKAGPRAMASKDAETATVAQGKLMLRADAAGGLSFSKDAGKHWKTVKPAWPGKVVQLATRAESPTSPETFQITTDSGSVWLSRDGTHWYPDSPQR
jgi:hypothetical protein